jgi:hypothetical protein
MSSTAPKVSFTIRRPSPESRATSSGPDSDNLSFKVPPLPRHITNDSVPGSPLARSANASPKLKSRTYEERDSSDEDDDGINDELVTGFDRFGVQRLHEKKKLQGPLIIPSLKNRDWRELARKRKAINRYVPASAKIETGTDGSVGGLGTRDTINSGPQLSGIQIKQKKVKMEMNVADVKTEAQMAIEEAKMEEETEDQRAIRALLSGSDGVEDGPIVDVIPQPVSETDAYRQDIDEFPDEATLDDYARVPVAQFGAALLRGMGWKEGAPASKNKKGMVEPWIPSARPALLGIGAKDQEVLDDGSKKLNTRDKSKPDKRYVPVVKKERASDASSYRDASSSASNSRSRKHSPPQRDSTLTSRRGSLSPSLGRRRSSRSERDDRYQEKDKDSHRSHRRDHDHDRTRYRDGDRRDRRD